MKTTYKDSWIRYKRIQESSEYDVQNYKAFVQKYKNNPYVRSKVQKHEDGYTENLFIYDEDAEFWEQVGSIEYSKEGQIVRSSDTWFDTDGMENLLKQVEEKEKEEYPAENKIEDDGGGAGGAAGGAAASGGGSCASAGAAEGYAGGLGSLAVHKKSNKKKRKKQFYDVS